MCWCLFVRRLLFDELVCFVRCVSLFVVCVVVIVCMLSLGVVLGFVVVLFCWLWGVLCSFLCVVVHCLLTSCVSCCCLGGIVFVCG